MDHLNLILLCLAGASLVCGVFWVAIQRAWLTAPLLSLVFGVIIGPDVTGGLDPQRWGVNPHHLLEQVLRLTIAISLLAIAVHLPRTYFWDRGRSIAVLLVPGMLLMWAISSVLAWTMVGGGLLLALLVGAAITPTDPVLAGTIATGDIARENIPARLRHLIYAESGANDGLAYLFLFLPVLLMQEPSAGEAWGGWLGTVLLREVLLAIVIGAVAGFVAGGAQMLSLRLGLGDRQGYLAGVLAMALAVVGGVEYATGGDGILAVFVAGITFHLVAHGAVEQDQDTVQDAVQRLLQLPAFVLAGMMLPWRDWRDMGWMGIVFAAAVLLLRRPVTLALLKPVIPDMHRARETLFLGWFGPIGAAGLYYALLAQRETGRSDVWAVASLIVVASTVLHGITATPLTRLLGRSEPRVELEGEPAEEAKPLSPAPAGAR